MGITQGIEKAVVLTVWTAFLCQNGRTNTCPATQREYDRILLAILVSSINLVIMGENMIVYYQRL